MIFFMIQIKPSACVLIVIRSFIKKLDGAQSVIKHGTSKTKMKEKKRIQIWNGYVQIVGRR